MVITIVQYRPNVYTPFLPLRLAIRWNYYYFFIFVRQGNLPKILYQWSATFLRGDRNLKENETSICMQPHLVFRNGEKF